MDWKQLLASMTSSVDEELRLRNAYLLVENRILRRQITGRLRLTDNDRQALAAIGQQLGRGALAEIATVATSETILAWHRKCAPQTCNGAKPRKSLGRPRIDQVIEDVVVWMARENRSWGYDRIVGALANLGYTISDQTVGNILKRHGIPPAPERKKTTTWKEFVRTHMDMLVATDFFTAEMWTWCDLMISAVLFCIPFGSRKVQVAGMTAYCKAWLLTWHTNAERWIGFAVAQGLVGLLQSCHRIPRLSPAVCAPHEYHVCLSRDIRKVVPLPVVAYRPIRDGPRRSRPRLGGRLQDVAPEAA